MSLSVTVVGSSGPIWSLSRARHAVLCRCTHEQIPAHRSLEKNRFLVTYPI